MILLRRDFSGKCNVDWERDWISRSRSSRKAIPKIRQNRPMPRVGKNTLRVTVGIGLNRAKYAVPKRRNIPTESRSQAIANKAPANERSRLSSTIPMNMLVTESPKRMAVPCLPALPMDDAERRQLATALMPESKERTNRRMKKIMAIY